jgi:hypothetical protein
MILRLEDIKAAAASKPDGWLDAVLSAGNIRGRFLEISRSKWVAISVAGGQWGDAVGAIARPIAAAIDGATAGGMVKTRLTKCGGCKRRHRKLNGGAAVVGSVDD